MFRFIQATAILTFCAIAFTDSEIANIAVQFSASNLVDLDAFEAPNPYLVVSCRDNHYDNFTLIAKTEVVEGSHDPHWLNTTVQLSINLKSNQTLRLEVFDFDEQKVYGDESLGAVQILDSKLVAINPGGNKSFPLSVGKIYVHVLRNDSPPTTIASTKSV